MRASSTPDRRRGHVLAGSGIGGGISAVLSVIMHSWLPLAIVGGLAAAVILIVGAIILILVLRGATPSVKCGSFELSFDKDRDDHDKDDDNNKSGSNGQAQITSGGHP